jgi:hypothetical protein
MGGLVTCRFLAFWQPAQDRMVSTVAVDVGVGDDLAFPYQPLHDLADNIVKLLIAEPVQVVVHMRFSLAALDEGYFVLLRHGLFNGKKPTGFRYPCKFSGRPRQYWGSMLIGVHDGHGDEADGEGTADFADFADLAPLAALGRCRNARQAAEYNRRWMG